MNNTDSESTNTRFIKYFVRYGILQIVETYFGSQYTFRLFYNNLKNGVEFVNSLPNHTSCNRCGENLVESIKNRLKISFLNSLSQDLSFKIMLYRYLFSYRKSITLLQVSLLLLWEAKEKLEIYFHKRSSIYHKGWKSYNLLPRKKGDFFVEKLEFAVGKQKY